MRTTLMIGIFFLVNSLSVFSQKKNQVEPIDTSGKKMLIKGVIEKGVEAGCIILKTKDNKPYLLLNLKTDVSTGSCIKATGYVQKNYVGICMQGIAFYVVNYCPCNKKTKPKYQRELPKDKIQKSN
ncbi:MAG: hypothetical protein N2203_03460 [Bacteroidia bacterium]|nr:hypothetical protein [Bacteroidia bacterium]